MRFRKKGKNHFLVAVVVAVAVVTAHNVHLDVVYSIGTWSCLAIF